MTMAWIFMTVATNWKIFMAVALVGMSFRAMVVILRAALVARAMAVDMLSMWKGVKMYLQIDKNLTRSFTTYIKVGLLTGIFQPEKILEKVVKFQIDGGHRG